MLPTFLVAMDMTALLLALPRLSASLGASGVQQLWISDSYGDWTPAVRRSPPACTSPAAWPRSSSPGWPL